MPEDNNSCLLTAQPIVTIMVDSPKDPPNSEFGVKVVSKDSSIASTTSDCDRDQKCSSDEQAFTFPPPPPIDPNEPIDVNQPRDTTDIFYDYEEPIQPNERPDEIIEQNIDTQSHTDVIPSTSGIIITDQSPQQTDNNVTNDSSICSGRSSSSS